jgi:RND family efflux transporter MFP subunit
MQRGSIMRKTLIGIVLALAFIMISLTLVGRSLPRPTGPAGSEAARQPATADPFAPAVTVARVAPARFTATVTATGSLVAREEILVGPEVEGLRVTEVLADEGQRVKKGDVLARLVADTLDAQVAQNDAALARTAAAIAQAKAAIVEAEAHLTESHNAYERGKPLRAAGHMTEATFDQREQAARTAEAQLAAAQDGLKVAEAERAQVEAQRRELMWRRGRVAVTAPADGIISRRMARVGGYAAGAAEPMFRIVAKGEVELDAEVVETRLAAVKAGQHARVDVAGLGEVEGTVRLVSPEVDKATRLGRVRIFLGDNPGLRVGAFARASIATATSDGLAVPAAAVLHGADGATVQRVRGHRVETRRIKTGLAAGTLVEVRDGLDEGDLVVARAGTFLREGDTVRPVPAELKSEVGNRKKPNHDSDF